MSDGLAVHTVGGDTAAIIAAASAVVGALVGALGSGLVEARLERNHQKARARAGARLVRSDLKSAAQWLGLAEVCEFWEVQWSGATPSWVEYRDVLAAFLEPTDWKTLDEGVTAVNGAQTAKLLSQGQFDVQRQLIVFFPGMKDNLRAWIDRARDAYNALASLAEGDIFEGDFGGILVGRRWDPSKETHEQAEEAVRELGRKKEEEEAQQEQYSSDDQPSQAEQTATPRDQPPRPRRAPPQKRSKKPTSRRKRKGR